MWIIWEPVPQMGLMLVFVCGILWWLEPPQRPAKPSPKQKSAIPAVKGPTDHEMLLYFYQQAKANEESAKAFDKAIREGRIPRLPGVKR